MTARTIIEYPNPLLRRVSMKVVDFDSGLQLLINDLVDTMLQQDSMGIAAPQIGISQQVFIIDIQRISSSAKVGKIKSSRELRTYSTSSGERKGIMCFINPVIVGRGTKVNSSEGCLSVPNIRGVVERFNTVQIEACNREGLSFTFYAEDMLSAIIQHEIDHLSGTLFIDKIIGREN